MTAPTCNACGDALVFDGTTHHCQGVATVPTYNEISGAIGMYAAEFPESNRWPVVALALGNLYAALADVERDRNSAVVALAVMARERDEALAESELRFAALDAALARATAAEAACADLRARVDVLEREAAAGRALRDELRLYYEPGRGDRYICYTDDVRDYDAATAPVAGEVQS